MRESCGLDRPEGMKADLHLHSSASGAATNVWVKGFGDDLGVKESYTPPETAYREAKRAGMDLVTLTDHESVSGAASLLHPDVFPGEEVCAVFPEDKSTVDVLLYNVDATVHREAQARRGDVYRLVAYLREAGIIHVLAHPMYGVARPLDREAVEKRLVLFGLWEFVNGSRPAAQNRLARDVARSVGAGDLRTLAARHGLVAPPHGRISGTGGSDDHGGLYIGTTFTVAPGARTKRDFLEALRSGEVYPAGEHGSVDRVTHTAFRLVGTALGDGGARGLPSPSQALRGLLPPRALAALSALSRAPRENKLLRSLPAISGLDQRAVRRELSARYEAHVGRAFGESKSGFPALDLLSSLGGFIDGHVFVAPYLAVHGYYGRETGKAHVLRRELGVAGEDERLKVGVFVDGLDDVHGVATLYTNIRSLKADGRWSLTVVCCGGPQSAGTVTLPSLGTLQVPLYEGLELGVPSLLDVFDHVAASGYRVLHVATPGPLGLAALVCGLVLGLPVVGAYHTEFGAYARALSDDAFVENIVEVAVREFYERCSAVTVPSQTTALALRNRGYSIKNFDVLKNGVDADFFSPKKRDPDLHRRLGRGAKVLLYVGRVSREKGLDEFTRGPGALLLRRDDVHLVVAGDGPYRRELERALGARATFTGFLEGEDLARTVASADVFVFPSATDTLGRAVSEAQASGLPAVVYDLGGPRECVLPGRSGLVARDPEGFFREVERLLDDAGLRREMGREARRFAESLDWRGVREGLIGLYSGLLGEDGAGASGLAAASRERP